MSGHRPCGARCETGAANNGTQMGSCHDRSAGILHPTVPIRTPGLHHSSRSVFGHHWASPYLLLHGLRASPWASAGGLVQVQIAQCGPVHHAGRCWTLRPQSAQRARCSAIPEEAGKKEQVENEWREWARAPCGKGNKDTAVLQCRARWHRIELSVPVELRDACGEILAALRWNAVKKYSSLETLKLHALGMVWKRCTVLYPGLSMENPREISVESQWFSVWFGCRFQDFTMTVGNPMVGLPKRPQYSVHPSSPIRISTVFPLHWARHVVCQQCI